VAETAPTIPSRSSAGGGLGTDFDCDGGLIPDICPTLVANGNRTGGNRPPGTDGDTVTALIPVLAHSLRAEGFDASEDGTGRDTPLVTAFYPTNRQPEFGNYDDVSPPIKIGSSGSSGNPPAIAFSVKDYGADAGPLAPTLRAGGHDKSHANGGVMPAKAYAFKPGQSEAAGGTFVTEEYAPTLQAANNGSTAVPAVAFDLRGREGGAQFKGPHDTANIRAASGGSSRSYVAAMVVRRLTPRECERLQGFPDDYSLVPYRGKPASDGPRFKALGNSMAVPVMRWIGERIALVEKLTQQESA